MKLEDRRPSFAPWGDDGKDELLHRTLMFQQNTQLQQQSLSSNKLLSCGIPDGSSFKIKKNSNSCKKFFNNSSSSLLFIHKTEDDKGGRRAIFRKQHALAVRRRSEAAAAIEREEREKNLRRLNEVQDGGDGDPVAEVTDDEENDSCNKKDERREGRGPRTRRDSCSNQQTPGGTSLTFKLDESWKDFCQDLPLGEC